jgi:hypothetical protein
MTTTEQQIRALSALGKGQLEIIGILRREMGMSFGEANRATHDALNLRDPSPAEQAREQREIDALMAAARRAGLYL